MRKRAPPLRPYGSPTPRALQKFLPYDITVSIGKCISPGPCRAYAQGPMVALEERHFLTSDPVGSKRGMPYSCRGGVHRFEEPMSCTEVTRTNENHTAGLCPGNRSTLPGYLAHKNPPPPGIAGLSRFTWWS